MLIFGYLGRQTRRQTSRVRKERAERRAQGKKGGGESVGDARDGKRAMEERRQTGGADG
ncbi:hypothetical protein BDY21DRAFT_331664 [Lineolata rhizophorae]|uniref:Uncharacterized protein n=1 Tax=Lineolata rhizophorae TaxID=578093 RepID=A0A6A6PBW7_9PEZI|nr:hypothetical protein BDY21DRAFT_331664 [Lineolata rhizophorae]